MGFMTTSRLSFLAAGGLLAAAACKERLPERGASLSLDSALTEPAAPGTVD